MEEGREGHPVINGSRASDPNDGLKSKIRVTDNEDINELPFGMANNRSDDPHSPGRFNHLETSGSFNLSLREPKFCKCLPLAKGVCFGFLSLKSMLISIALLDITIGGAALGIGITAYLKLKLEIALIFYVIMNSICLVLAFACLYAINIKHLRLLRFYYIWKCIEVVVVPLVELIILAASV